MLKNKRSLKKNTQKFIKLEKWKVIFVNNYNRKSKIVRV